MPSLLSKALGFFAQGRKSVGFDPGFAEYFNLLQSWSGVPVTLESALKVSVAMACGRVISEGIAMLPVKIMQATDRLRSPARSHPLYDKLATSPNPLQTAFEFFESMGLHLAFSGKAYVYTPRVSGRIDGLYLLEPAWVTVEHRWPQRPTYRVTTDTGPLTLQADEVWEVKGPSWCTYTALEPLELARQALGLSMSIEQGQAKLNASGVRVPGFISVKDTLTDPQHEKLSRWVSKVNAEAATGRNAVLDMAATWVSQSMSNVDAQTMEQRKFQIEEICRFFRVMPIMVGYSDKAATYASAEQMFLAHLVHTIGPWARRIEQSIDKWLLSVEERRTGLYSNMNEKALLRMSAKDQADYLKGLTNSGIMVRNEAREILDLNPIDGLDDPLTPVNTVAGEPPRVDDDPEPTRTTEEETDR